MSKIDELKAKVARGELLREDEHRLIKYCEQLQAELNREHRECVRLSKHLDEQTQEKAKLQADLVNYGDNLHAQAVEIDRQSEQIEELRINVHKVLDAGLPEGKPSEWVIGKTLQDWVVFLRDKNKRLKEELKQMTESRDVHSKVRQRHLVRYGKCSSKLQELEVDNKRLMELVHKSMCFTTEQVEEYLKKGQDDESD